MVEAIRIYKSELEAICNQVSLKQYYNIEIGGDLYGLWADDGTPIVFLATGPGPEAVSYEYKFHQDNKAIMQCEKYLFQEYGIQYLGDWHSHHILGLKHPSGGDAKRIQNLLQQPGRHRMIEFIVTHDYSQSSRNEKICGYYYEKDKKLIQMPIEELDTRKSLIREDLIARNSAINLMEQSCNADVKKTTDGIYSSYTKEEIKRSNIQSKDFDYYNLLFNGIVDKIIKYIK